jgi:hypothetical protein
VIAALIVAIVVKAILVADFGPLPPAFAEDALHSVGCRFHGTGLREPNDHVPNCVPHLFLRRAPSAKHRRACEGRGPHSFHLTNLPIASFYYFHFWNFLGRERRPAQTNSTSLLGPPIQHSTSVQRKRLIVECETL